MLVNHALRIQRLYYKFVSHDSIQTLIFFSMYSILLTTSLYFSNQLIYTGEFLYN